jgi:ferredoxin-NADP reductase
MSSAVKVPAVVAEIITHGPDLRSYILAPLRPIPRFRPGQFLQLAIDGYDPASHWPESRAFSIASSPMQRDRLHITVSRHGKFTERLFDAVSIGKQVWLNLPFGDFTPEFVDGGETVILAGGSGITPFVSFALWAQAKQQGSRLKVHYAAKTPADLIYRRMLDEALAALAQSSLTLYAESGAEQDPAIVSGRIDIPAVWRSLDAAKKARFYMAGPKGMVAACKEGLLKEGVAPAAICIDQWG